jgi:CheY-like chemotaxis protein
MARILVIDDQPDIRDVIKNILEECGHSVILAAEGAEGLRFYAKAPADVVITDLHMPGMNGLDTVRALRERSHGVKIIAMSGADTFMVEKNLQNSVINGADQTLLKPFRVRDIINAVELVLSGGGEAHAVSGD